MSGGMGGGEAGVDPPTSVKGDLSGFDTTFARIPVGVDGQVVTADSTVPLGLAWETTGGGSETHEFTSIETYNPTSQTGIIQVSVDVSTVVDGQLEIKVDGSSIETITTGSKTRVVNPTTSLSLVTSGSPYSVSAASYSGNSFDVTSQESQPHGMYFKSDGTEMYVVGKVSDRIYQYTLSTAWDVSTATLYDSVYVGTQALKPTGLFLKPDGTACYITSETNGYIYKYLLSIAWNISTASYDSQFNGTTQLASPTALFFKSDGTKMYTMGLSSSPIFQYTLSTPWSISTASYDSISFSISSEESNAQGLFFKPDGTKMYITGFTAPATVYQYSLSTAWDISTGSYDSVSFNASSQVSWAASLFFKPDGNSMYILDNNGDIVFQYTTLSGFTSTMLSSIS